jgi:hypothetical protein
MATGWFTLLRDTNGLHLALIMAILFSVYVKWSVGLNGYSGK